MIKRFFSQPFFTDSRAITLAVIGLTLLMMHTIGFSLAINSQEIKIPIRYSGYDASLSDKGPWYSLLIMVVFSIVVYLINVLISIKLYNLRKALAIAMLSYNIIVMLFLNLISRALVNLV